MKMIPALCIGAAAALSGCAGMSDDETAQKAVAVMKTSFSERGQAKLDRLDQDETQKLCSIPPATVLPKDVSDRIEKSNLAAIKYPADGKLLGNWRDGEKIAQSGIGKQYSDDPKLPSGANCYACHQLTKEEISFGTIGPSLYNFGKVRGNSEAIQRYAYGKVYNAQAFSACSNMPRFGHKGILTEQQIKDVTALLLDPASPVNQ
jgi:L-cysteine S-thiosulfotransferase